MENRKFDVAATPRNRRMRAISNEKRILTGEGNLFKFVEAGGE